MRIAQLSLLALLGTMLFSCKTENTTTVPLVERNEEVREYIDVVADLVDEYCILAEKMIDKAESIDDKEKNGEETTLLDGIDMLSGMATSALKIKRLTDEINEMEAKQKEFEQKLSTADYEELLEVYGKTVARFYELAQRADALK